MNEAAALEAVERILNRGGEPADVVAAVVAALRERGFEATATGGSLKIGGASEGFVARVTTLVSPYRATS